jgi:uncharacterized integral membrane protein
MNLLGSSLALLVSVLTITQGVRALSASSRLRDRLAKDLAIRKELSEGAIRDELDLAIETSTIELIVREKYRPNWYALPIFTALIAVNAGTLVYLWTEVGTPAVSTLLGFSVTYIGAVFILLSERARLRHLRRPLLTRLRAATDARSDVARDRSPTSSAKARTP